MQTERFELRPLAPRDSELYIARSSRSKERGSALGEGSPVLATRRWYGKEGAHDCAIRMI